MKRSRALATAVVVCALIVAALVLLLLDRDDVERRARRVVDESASRPGVATDLSVSTDVGGTRVASAAVAPPATAPTSSASTLTATPRPPGVLVTLDGEPVPGATVELWCDDEVLEFVTDENGFVEVDAEIIRERSWSVVCGWNGCVPNRDALYLRDWQQFITIQLVRSELAHVEVVRSDGRVYGDPHTGQITGVWSRSGTLRLTPERRGEFYGTTRGSPNRLPRNTLRNLQLAGLRLSQFPPGFVWFGPWIEGEESVVLSGAFREADTQLGEWSVRAAPLATGGAFTRVDLEVLEEREVGVLEVAIVEPYEGCLLDVESLELELRVAGELNAHVARLVVLEDDWRYVAGSSPRLRFEIEPGTFDARLRADLGWEQYAHEHAAIDLRAGKETRLELALPPMGAVDVVGLPPREWSERFAIFRIDGDDPSAREPRRLLPQSSRAPCLRAGRYVAFTEESEFLPRALLAPRPMTFAEVAHHPWFAGEDVPAPWERIELDVDADGDGENDLAPEDPILARIAFDLEAGEIETLYFVPWPEPQLVEEER